MQCFSDTLFHELQESDKLRWAEESSRALRDALHIALEKELKEKGFLMSFPRTGIWQADELEQTSLPVYLQHAVHLFLRDSGKFKYKNSAEILSSITHQARIGQWILYQSDFVHFQRNWAIFQWLFSTEPYAVIKAASEMRVSQRQKTKLIHCWLETVEFGEWSQPEEIEWQGTLGQLEQLERDVEEDAQEEDEARDAEIEPSEPSLTERHLQKHNLAVQKYDVRMQLTETQETPGEPYFLRFSRVSTDT
jgi:hypothetical protein